MTPKRTSIPRRALIMLVAALQAMVLAAAVQAATFDAKARAPEAPSNIGLQARIREYFAVYAQATAESPSGIVSDKAACDKWFDTQWRLERAIDTRRDLGDLSEFGMTPRGDGSYAVDVANFPQWTPLQQSLSLLLDPEQFVTFEQDLRERGLRDQDIDALKAYVAVNHPRRAALAENLPLVESFAAGVEAQLAKKQKIGMPQLMSYLYQSNRNHAEATRKWALGLLAKLDGQRQRILESYFAERSRSTTRVIAPDDMDAQSKWLLGVIASGEYRALIEKEKRETMQ